MNEGYKLSTYCRVARIFTEHVQKIMPIIEHVVLFSSMDNLPLKLSKVNDWKVKLIGFTMKDFFGDVHLEIKV